MESPTMTDDETEAELASYAATGERVIYTAGAKRERDSLWFRIASWALTPFTIADVDVLENQAAGFAPEVVNSIEPAAVNARIFRYTRVNWSIRFRRGESRVWMRGSNEKVRRTVLSEVGYTNATHATIFPRMLQMIVDSDEFSQRTAITRGKTVNPTLPKMLVNLVLGLKSTSGLPLHGHWIKQRKVYLNTIIAAVNQAVLSDHYIGQAVPGAPQAPPDFRHRAPQNTSSSGASRTA